LPSVSRGTTFPTTASGVYEAMARMGFELFAELPVTDQQLVLDLSQHPNALNSCLNYLRHEAGGRKLVGDRETKPFPSWIPHSPLERKSSMKTISALTVLLLSSVCWSGVEGLSRMGTRLEE
jgi:hypothetical protein